MLLTIWRHGEAGEAVNDRSRQLTARGSADIEKGAREFSLACAAQGLPAPSSILHSPWERTRQTAALLHAEFSRSACGAEERLKPGAVPSDVDHLFSAHGSEAAPQAHHLFVSHQPLVSRLVDYYLGEPGVVPPLSPGGLAVLALDAPGPSTATLLFWSLPPLYQVCR